MFQDFRPNIEKTEIENEMEADCIYVALCGWAAKADDSIVCFGANQTKDSWTWNLAVSGSGKGTRERQLTGDPDEAVGGWTAERQLAAGQQRGKQQRVGGWTAERQAAEGWRGTTEGQSTPDSRDSRRQDRVQWRRVSRCLHSSCLWNFR